ncbi:Inositol monophosphatase 2 [Cichlidogyrus casuarinus]|uniref:Inositol monophosphatase 2 n=1 Tax=Cichlidogyrus casuarinus TaxID=1844966 RepID=A0ABD2Q5F5_9PLAT
MLINFYNNSEKTIETKETFADIVTESDKAIENFIIKKITSKFPDHIIFAEESNKGSSTFTDHPTWFIDPIDGTSNFASS